jgi:hypothetical protein
MAFNATFTNISGISWRSVLLVEKTLDLSQVTDKLYHTMCCHYAVCQRSFTILFKMARNWSLFKLIGFK